MLYLLDYEFPDRYHLFIQCGALPEFMDLIFIEKEIPITGRICAICEAFAAED